MITLKEAITIAEKETGGKVTGVLETSDRWIFDFDFEEDSLISVVFCCMKDSGEFKYFFPPDEPDILKHAQLLKEPGNDND